MEQDNNALHLKNDLPEGDYRIDTYKIHDNIGMWLDKSCLQYFGSCLLYTSTLPEAELPAFIVEIPADVKNGDIASNLAMAGARTWRKAPKMIADALLAHLPSIENSVFSKVEVGGDIAVFHVGGDLHEDVYKRQTSGSSSAFTVMAARMRVGI